MTQQPRAVVLVSGGLDSATVLAMAKAQGFACYALSVNYGQRHIAELEAAKNVSKAAVDHKIIDIDLSAFGGSALTDMSIDVPSAASIDAERSDSAANDIPVTYVPARNTIMLSLALAWAESLSASHIFVGVNAVDYSGYPDCRPEYIQAFQTMANLATKAAVNGEPITVHSPLIRLTKGEIITAGNALGVDYGATVSCYQANDAGEACGQCDSCRLRRQGFDEAGVVDPTRYQA